MLRAPSGGRTLSTFSSNPSVNAPRSFAPNLFAGRALEIFAALGAIGPLLLFWALDDWRPLGPGHTALDIIRSRGGGRFSHWANALYFSSSDGTVPATNGRSYKAVLAAYVRPWISLAIARGALNVA